MMQATGKLQEIQCLETYHSDWNSLIVGRPVYRKPQKPLLNSITLQMCLDRPWDLAVLTNARGKLANQVIRAMCNRLPKT